MGTNPTPTAAGTPQTQGRPATPAESSLFNRHPVHPQDRLPLGIPSPGNGVRLWHDLLASFARLASGGCLEKDLATVAGRTGTGRTDRLVDLGNRQLFGAGAFWGAQTGPNPTDRGKNGSKRHLMTDGQGTPLAIMHSGANVHDSQMAIALVDAVPPIKQPSGRPRQRPDEMLADRAYDAEEKIRKPLRQRKITPLIARRNTEHGSGLGQYRYVVEAAFAWLFNQRRLRVRYEKRDDIHEAFLIIGCLLICWRRINRYC